MTHDILATIKAIAQVGAQKYAPQKDPVLCDDCLDYEGKRTPATESWAVPIPPFAEHYCAECADKRRERACR